MYGDLSVAVVVPAHNESLLIGRTISTMPDFVDVVIVVDDASTDGTSEAAGAAGDPRVRLIRHEVNTGVGGAVLDGHRLALAEGYDVSVVMAGDNQMDPHYLGALLTPIVDGEAQFTKANRFFSKQSYQGMPRHRVIGNVVLSFLTKAASGYWHLFDPQNGYTAIHRDALARLDLDEIATGYEFENSLLIALNIRRVRARDVPIPAVYGEEVSGIRLGRVSFAITRALVRGFWSRMIRKYVMPSFSPVALFFFTGLALCLIGSAFGLFVVVNSIGPRTASTATVLLAVAPILTGTHLLISATMLDIQESPGRPQ